MVTERGRSIATINPVEAPADVDWAHQLVAEGHARWNGGKPTGAKRPAKITGRMASSQDRDRGPPVMLYLDTSRLVKLYVTEAGSDVVRQLVGGAKVVATSVVACAETRASLARLRREGVLTAHGLEIGVS